MTIMIGLFERAIGWRAVARSDEVRGHFDPVSQGTESKHTYMGNCSGTEYVHV